MKIEEKIISYKNIQNNKVKNIKKLYILYINNIKKKK